MQDVDFSRWPLKTTIYYGEPVIVCGGWTERKLVTGTTWPEHCDMEISGSNLREILASLEEHVASVTHVPSPFERK